VAAAFAALVVLGTNPFGLDDLASISGTAVAVTVILGLAVMRRRGRAGATTPDASTKPACALTRPDGRVAGSDASATW
jgi:hypothetical protein